MTSQIESGFPIPSDWLLPSGKWAGVCVTWPDSEAWRLHLRSLLYHITRGRSWDQQSGTITTVQAIAWEIFRRNDPFVPCQDCQPCEDGTPGSQNGTSGAFGACSAGNGEDDNEMGQVVTDVTIVDGKLTVWFGPCCSKTLEDFVTGQTGQNMGDDPLNPDGDPDFVYSACGKANAIVEMVFSIVDAAWQEIDSLPFLWEIIPNIESAVGYDLDNNWIVDLMSNVVATSLAGFEAADFQDSTSKQRILCRLVSMFQDSAAGVVDNAAFESIRSVFCSEVRSVWEFTAELMFQSAINALGRVDMDTVAKLGAGDTTTNCDCPAEETAQPFEQYGLDKAWRYVFDFQTGTNGFVLDGSGTHQNATGLWADNQITDHIANIVANLDFDNVNNGSTLLLVGLIWTNVGDETWNSQVKCGVNNLDPIGMADLVNLGGTAPATPGTFTVIASVNHALGAGDDQFRLQLQAEHLTDVSQKLVAVLFAGSGPGPMTV